MAVVARPTTLEELARELAQDEEFAGKTEAEQDDIFQSVAADLDLERTPTARLIRESEDPIIQETEERIARRPSAIQEALKRGDFGPQGGIGSSLRASAAFFEALESVPANIILGEQRGAFPDIRTDPRGFAAGVVETAEDVLAGLKGERPATLGDPLRARLRSMGVPSAVATPAAAFAGLELATLGGASQLIKGAAALTKRGLAAAGRAIRKTASRVKNDILGRSLRELTTAQGRAETELLKPFADRLAEAKAIKNKRIQAARFAREEAQASLNTEAKARMRALTEDQQLLSQEMQETAKGTVLKIRERFPAVAKRTSNEYQDILNRALGGLEDTQLPLGELAQKLETRLAGQPEALSMAQKMLGIKAKPTAALEEFGVAALDAATQQQLAQAQLSGQVTTVGKVLKNMQKARGKIGRAAKGSERVYTFQEKIADDVASALVELLEEAGVEGLDEASAFWAQWAPIRNQAFRDFKVFLKTPTELEAGIKRLVKVAKGKDIGNAEYIRILEKELGIPLTDDLKVLVARLNASKKEQLATQVMRDIQAGRVGTASREVTEEARRAYTKIYGTVTAEKEAAAAVLKGAQTAEREALIQRAAGAKLGFNVVKWVVLYRVLRSVLNQLLPD